MINKVNVCFKLDNRTSIASDLAVKLHGAAMTSINPKNAEELHNGKSHPISIYSEQSGLTSDTASFQVCSLVESMNDFVDFFYNQNDITIYGSTVQTIKKESVKRETITLQQAIESISSNYLTLNFITPAMFKQNHKPSFIPSPERYFSSVIAKINEYENTQITVENFQKAWSSLQILDYRINSQPFNVTGMKLKGMKGYIKVKLPPDTEKAVLIRSVIAYAQYSGIGAKTSQGMGGFKVENN